jgi:hypothetical protein
MRIKAKRRAGCEVEADAVAGIAQEYLAFRHCFLFLNLSAEPLTRVGSPLGPVKGASFGNHHPACSRAAVLHLLQRHSKSCVC